MPLLRLVAAADLQPGMVREILAGDRVWAVCNVDGDIRVVSGECPHRDGPLGHGALHGYTVVCPWHAREFDVRTGECSMGLDCRIGTYPVTLRDGHIFIDPVG
jgi:nitrite reductase/ring-hydroxylating ferredoxin subunit